MRLEENVGVIRKSCKVNDTILNKIEYKLNEIE